MSRIAWIDPSDDASAFPAPRHALAEPNGLIAAGGSLSPKRLELAYRSGVFPWFGEDQPVLWWSPDPRTIFRPGQMHLSRSLRRHLRRTRQRVTLDTAFPRVIDSCAAPRPDQSGTWITPEMRQAYIELHQLGRAHSVEVWDSDALVGGLYGVALGAAFFGESMFSSATNASKVALTYLLAQLRRWRFLLLDCQMPTAHLLSLGAVNLPRGRFVTELDAALRAPDQPLSWILSNDLDPCEAAVEAS